MKELTIIGKRGLSKDQFERITNWFVKPNGGLWASPLLQGVTAKNGDEVISGWHNYLYYSMPEWITNDVVFLNLKEDAKVFEIHSKTDLDRLAVMTGTYFGCIDYEKAALHYDAIWLTDEGQENTRCSTPLNLCGWDCESVLILNWDAIASWEYRYMELSYNLQHAIVSAGTKTDGFYSLGQRYTLSKKH